MAKNEPMLQINIPRQGNPRCSICGEEFGGEGLARDLIVAFMLHVRRKHMDRVARTVRNLPGKGKFRRRRLLNSR
jgi:hypothetical protein